MLLAGRSSSLFVPPHETEPLTTRKWVMYKAEFFASVPDAESPSAPGTISCCVLNVFLDFSQHFYQKRNKWFNYLDIIYEPMGTASWISHFCAVGGSLLMNHQNGRIRHHIEDCHQIGRNAAKTNTLPSKR